MFRKDLKTLKEHIYIKRKKQFDGYCEIKTSLTGEDIILQIDFAKS